MTALTQDRNTLRRDGNLIASPVAGGARIFTGALVAINAAGFAVPGSTSATLAGAGTALAVADNTLGGDGAMRVRIDKRPASLGNSTAGDAITLAHIGADCYIVDDQTVARTDGGGTRSRAGKVYDVDEDGVWVDFH